MTIHTPENKIKAIQYLKTATVRDITGLALKAYTELQKLGPYLIQGEKDLKNLNIGWMDNVFRPDNEKRRQTALTLNRGIQDKVAKLKSFIKMQLIEIRSGNFDRIKSAVDKITKMNISIHELDMTEKVALGGAISLVITLLAVAGIIVIAGGPVGWMIGLAAIASLGAAYLIVEGIAVGKRYEALEQIITKYNEIDSQMEKLLQKEVGKDLLDLFPKL